MSRIINSFHRELEVLLEPEWSQKLEVVLSHINSHRKSTDIEARPARISIELCNIANVDFDSITTLGARLEVRGKSVLGYNILTKLAVSVFFELDGLAFSGTKSFKQVCSLKTADI